MKRVICINVEGSEDMLVKGKEYKVFKEWCISDSECLYLVQYDELKRDWFLSTRFEEVSKNNEKPKVEDVVNNPSHYKGNKGIETIDFIENVLTKEEFIGYLRGNVIKYQSRANLKGRKEEDLKKAKWYSDKLVEVLKDEN